MKAYDSAELIASSYLTDLAGLNRLRRERVAAGYDRKERLSEFLLLGRYAVDTCGNFGKITELGGRRGSDAFRPELFAPVVPLEVLRQHLPGLSIGYEVGTPLPASNHVCPVCKTGWTLENAHDYVDPHHPACASLVRAVESREEFYPLVAAVFAPCAVHDIPNEYCPCERCPPWFGVRTVFGPIKIGWRKRVINIDWSGTGATFPDLFADQDVTKWDGGVHAWGYDKAAEYLLRLAVALKARRDGAAS